MTALTLLRTAPLPRDTALLVSDALDNTGDPAAQAVSVVEVDEAADLWAAEALYARPPDAPALEAHLVSVTGRQIAFSIEPLPGRDWVRDSLSRLAPVRAGRLFVHGSHDKATRPAGRICVEIDAGAAFGTGHHDTTLGCLMALQHVVKHARPRAVLDVGCGSGVLAIAACRLAPCRAIACDNDPEAVKVARKNAVINAVHPRLRCLTAHGTAHRAIVARAPFDLIFANFLANPLIRLAPGLATVLAPGGHLILSGLRHDQARPVIAAYRARGLVLRAAMDKRGWTTLTMTPMRKGTA